MNTDYSTGEMLAVLLSRDLKDGETGAAGAAALIPMAAILLARASHAPNMQIAGEMFVNPYPKVLSPSMLDDRALGKCEAAETFVELFGHSHRGLDFFFHSGLQYDCYGNVNLHCIGPWDRPTVRGPGAANFSYAIRSKRFYICALDHSPRSFVERVDFLTIPGNLTGPESRREAGLTQQGPRFVVTPFCVFDFDEQTLRMRLKSLHAGVSYTDVASRTGFDFGVSANLSETEPPTAAELHLLRTAVDPGGALKAIV